MLKTHKYSADNLSPLQEVSAPPIFVMSSASEILGRIEDDPVFKGFLEAGFDPAAFASKIVKADVGKAASANGPVLLQVEGAALPSGAGAATSIDQRMAVISAESVSSQAEITLDSMSAHIARIEAAIRAHILDNEEDFLGSVGGVSELSRRTEEFRSGIRELRRSFMRLRREVSEPHEAVRLRTQQLKNLHAATRLLKRALRFLTALRRLRAQEEALGLDPSGGTKGGGTSGKGGADLRELAKAAQSLQELEGTLGDADVASLDIVSRERPYVEACGAAVRRKSAEHLARGMKALNQTDVGGALQVFFNLGCLPARVKACVIHLGNEADAAASSSLQLSALVEATSSGVSPASIAAVGTAAAGVAASAKSSTPPPSGSGASRGFAAREAEAAAARRKAARMRAHAGKLAASLYTTSMEAWGLQRVLAKKRDPTTRVLLDAVVRCDRSADLGAGAYRAYWDGLCGAVRGAVVRALAADGVNVAGGGSGGGGGGGGSGAALVAIYPSLRKAFLHLMTRLEQGTEGSRRVDGGGSGAHGFGGLTAPDATVTQGASTSGYGGIAARLGPGAPGVLGDSRWLSLALDADDDDDFPSDVGLRHRDRLTDGPEAGAGVASGGSDGRRISGLRLRTAGIEGVGIEVDGRVRSRGYDGGDRARLLEALAPLRDLFLARSLKRLTTPVEQMFPQFDGYMAAVPSKHDLASFVRSIHAELALAVPMGSAAGGRQAAVGSAVSDAEAGGGGNSGGATEADLSLIPLLLKGVVKAVKLLCTKVERMHSAEKKTAFNFGGLPSGPGVGVDDGSVRGVGDVSAAVAAASTGPPREAWTPSTEQEHNLQLLELVVKLREAMLGIPSLLVPKGEKLAVGVAAGSGGGGFEAACRDQIADAVNALDEIASDVILEPYLSRVALSLEEVIAKMHRENFGSGAADATSAPVGDAHGSGSLFLLELQGALAALQADHFGRISALRAPCAQASLRSLAVRLLRSYVTHCALLRPLSEIGKAKVAQDMATLEIALSPLARVSELGGVYRESKAFRTLLFVDDEDGGGRDSRSFLTEACMAHLRPSSVLHYLFSRAPDELSSPHVSRGVSEQAYVAWLLGGGAAAEAVAREDAAGAETGAGGQVRGGVRSTIVRSTLTPDTSYPAEAGAWAVVQGCLDAYHQRRGAISGGGGFGANAAELPRVIALISEAGPALLSGYEARTRASSA